MTPTTRDRPTATATADDAAPHPGAPASSVPGLSSRRATDRRATDRRATDRRATDQARPTSELSVGNLVKLAAEQTADLVRDELSLAKAELTRKGRSAGVAAALIAVGAVVAFYGVGAATAAVVLAVAQALPAWLAAVIVAAALLVAAGILALVGAVKLRHAAPPVPAEAVDGVRTDVHALTDAVKDRGQR